MREREEKNIIYYGRDVFSRERRGQEVKSISFERNINIEQLTIKDFYYSSFRFSDYDYILYDNNCESGFAVASIFSTDYFAIDNLEESIKFEERQAEKSSVRKTEKSVFSEPQLLSDVSAADVLSIDNDFSSDKSLQYEDYYYKIFVKNNSGKITISLNLESSKKLFDSLSSFFSLDSQSLKIIKNKDLQVLSEKYYPSLFRSCIIATKAALKFDSDILYSFRPFYIIGALDFSQKIRIKKSNMSLLDTDINIDYYMGMSNLYKDKFIKGLEDISKSILLAQSKQINLNLKYEKHQNSTLSPNDFLCAVYSFVSLSFIKSAAILELDVEYFLSLIVNANIDKINPESITAKDKVLDASKYKLKKSIYANNAQFSSDISSLERKKNTVIDMLVHFEHECLFVLVVEYDALLREIKNIYMSLPESFIENKENLINIICKGIDDAGFGFSQNFTENNISFCGFDTRADIDYGFVCNCFLNCFRLRVRDL